MKWTRRLLSFGLVLALLAGVSCTASDGPTGVPLSQPVEQPAQLLGSALDGLGGAVDDLGGVVDGVLDAGEGVISGILDVTSLLTCEEQSYAVTHKTIGPNGGVITVGRHMLVIPQGALSQNVRIKAEQMQGSTNSVRFSPEGLQFQKPATLALSYQNCQNTGVPKAVVYTSEKLDILEVLRSLDLLRAQTIAAPIDHFSRYAVAF